MAGQRESRYGKALRRLILVGLVLVALANVLVFEAFK